MTEYKEPELSVIILDYCKPIESKILLESIKRHVKIPHKTIFLDNGSGESYSYEFLKSGLVDQLIINRESLGLGIGSRDLHAITTTSHVCYCQNDQQFQGDLTLENWIFFKKVLEGEITCNEITGKTIKSISLAGYPCGPQIFSERAFLMKTDFYKSLEPLSLGGAGFLHHLQWREGQIQDIYKKNNWIHLAIGQHVADNGVFAVRDMGDCGVYCHRTDTKACFVVVPPKNRNQAYPKVNDSEFDLMKQGKWEDGRIPEQEIPHSFDCWSNTQLGRMEKEYIDNLRERFKNKGKL